MACYNSSDTHTVGHCRQTTSGVQYVKPVSEHITKWIYQEAVRFTSLRDEDRRPLGYIIAGLRTPAMPQRLLLLPRMSPPCAVVVVVVVVVTPAIFSQSRSGQKLSKRLCFHVLFRPSEQQTL